jgi:RNA polymerase sigma-70 factor (ECF subfamily)
MNVPRKDNPHKGVTALVKRAKSGDDKAFEELVRRYRQRIFALTLHITGNQSDADDVTQEVFLNAYRALDRFEGRSQFFTWLYRMAVNRSLNLHRSRSRRRETGMDDPRVELAVAVDAAGNPLKGEVLRRTYKRLLSALDELSPTIRTSVVLVILQGLSHEEAAIIQDCRPGTIAWRIHEARQRLRQALHKDPTGKLKPEEEPSDELVDLLDEWDLPVPSAN